MRAVLRTSLALLLVAPVGCGGDGSPTDDGGTDPPVATTISLSPSTLTFTSLDDSEQLSATVVDQRGNAMPGASITWTSSPSGVVSVSETGLVTAMGNGAATITATSGSATQTASAAVEQLAVVVAVTPSADTVFVTGSTQLSAAARDANGHDVVGKTTAWSSSNEAVVTVDDSGLVTGVSPGVADVTGEVDGQAGGAEVTVSVLSAPTLSGAGTSTVAAVTWSSSRNSSFAAFELYRDTQPGVTRQSVLVEQRTSPSDTSLIDVSVTPGATYYYRVFEAAADGASAGSNEIAVTLGSAIELGAVGFDLAVDAVRDLVYVSLPILNEIAIVSPSTNQVIDRVIVGSRPHGIDISDDNSTLYVALNGAGSVAALDLATHSATEIVVGDSLGHATAYDVAEGAPDRVFVSADPGSSGLAWIVMIATDQGNAYKRVASHQIIRAAPVFEKSFDRTALYIGEGFSPNSLYRLDVTDTDAPIVLEDQHGSVDGTSSLSITPDGLRIYLRSGQVLRTGSFIQAGIVGSGVPEVSPDGSHVFVATCDRPLFPGTCTLEIYDTGTFLQVDALPVDGPGATRMAPHSDANGVWLLAADLLHAIVLP